MDRVRMVALAAFFAAAGAVQAQSAGNDSSSEAKQQAPVSTQSTRKAEEAPPVNADNLTDESRKRLTKGFTLVLKDEVNFYCRTEKPIGTRLGKRQCYTIEQLIEMERIRVQTQRRWERRQYEKPTDVG
jgi:hypothetical protein